MIELDMSDLGLMHYFLGIEVVQYKFIKMVKIKWEHR